MIMVQRPIGDSCPYCVRSLEHEHIDTETAQALIAATPKICEICHEPVVFPSDDDPQFIGDTSVTSKCRHVIHFRITSQPNDE